MNFLKHINILEKFYNFKFIPKGKAYKYPEFHELCKLKTLLFFNIKK